LKITDNETLVGLNASGMSYTDIGRQFGLTRGQVASKIRLQKVKDDKYRHFNVVNLGTPLVLSGDFMIIGDIHVPTTDYDFAGLVSRVAVKNNIKRLVIGGDTFNMDAFSLYDTIVAQPTFVQERDAARILFKNWLEWFDEIYIIMGNHDRRLQRWTAGQLDEKDIFGMITTNEKVRISNYGYLTINTKAQYPWRVTHSKNYSVNQLTVANELANKFQCNIISHHEHHLAIGWDRWKRFVLVNNGGLFDQSQLAYVILDDGKLPGMTNGFTMLKNGCASLFGKYPFSDWSSYF
jgi:VCBS repeat-containing protein